MEGRAGLRDEKEARAASHSYTLALWSENQTSGSAFCFKEETHSLISDDDQDSAGY